eukprot:scaffold654_cov207-Ochromonas_danica.AAC.17
MAIGSSMKKTKSGSATFRHPAHQHFVKWLEWKDLSRLDIACVGKSIREEWLNSLTYLRISYAFESVSNTKLMILFKYRNIKVRIFYEWLRSRKVFFVEDFPIGLDFLEDLVTVLDMEYYCPVLRSIKILACNNNGNLSDISLGVTVWMSNFDSDIVLSVLIEQLRENSLLKISLQNVERHHETNVRVTDLIKKHASSLRDFRISTFVIGGEVDVDYIVSTLFENQIFLRLLTISLRGEPSQVLSSLMSYLSSSGGLLEVLEVKNLLTPFDADELVVSVATSCPKLNRLVTYGCEPCRIETLLRLYERCPHLQHVSFGSLKIDEKRKSVSIEVKGHNEDWAICLSQALRRRQYKKVTLRLSEGYYHPVRNLKSILEPYEIDLDAPTTSESSLISLLQDLPHVNSLHLLPTVNSQYTDATLAAISKHANSMTELKLKSINVSDKQLSELIKTCQLLKRLTMNDCGLESLEAISKLSDLNMVNLTMLGSVSEQLLEGLLFDENVTWPSTLKEGSIKMKLTIQRLISFTRCSAYDDRRLFPNKSKNKKIEQKQQCN